MIIEIDNKLEPKDLVPGATIQECANLIKEKLEKKVKFDTGRVWVEGNYFHFNYLYYLNLCWSAHKTAVITPDIFWHTIMGEMSKVIAAQPNKYRNLFTTSQDKRKIAIYTDDPDVLPMDRLMQELKTLVPSNLATSFTARFSTSTDNDIEAIYCSFADMVSPYYDYCTYACGIPALDIHGTVEDWQNIKDRINEAAALDIITVKYQILLLNIVYAIIDSLNGQTVEGVKNIYKRERCGSGSEYEIFGWATNMFIEAPRLRKIHNFPSMVSTVEFRNLTSGVDFLIVSGLFSSTLENNTLVPQFGKIIYEKGV